MLFLFYYRFIDYNFLMVSVFNGLYKQPLNILRYQNILFVFTLKLQLFYLLHLDVQSAWNLFLYMM